MTRIHHAFVVIVALLLNASPTHAEDCRQQTTGDICVAGSPWSDFTQFRVQLRGQGSSGTSTLTMHGRDFSIDVEDGRATRGTMIVIDGRAMLMRDVPYETGYEIDALDGPALMHQLVMTLLDQAFPKGPSSVGASAPIKITQKKRALSIATRSAEGRFEAPWTLTGTARRDGDRIEYDLQFVFTADASRDSVAFSGFWENAPVPPLDNDMSLDGWTVHWLTPMTSTSEQGTILDYGAKPASEHWADLAALRKYIADAPSRRARGRVPADVANPGPAQMFSYEAFAIGKGGARQRLGESTREYRPGVDVFVEQLRPDAWKKVLSLDYGLSVSATVYPKEKLTGFGLVLSKNDSGFSWEWFNREDGNVFRKLLGGGKVRISTVQDTGSQELVAVEFLDDIVLTCENDSDGVTHEVRVKKGSVLRFKP